MTVFLLIWSNFRDHFHFSLSWKSIRAFYHAQSIMLPVQVRSLRFWSNVWPPWGPNQTNKLYSGLPWIPTDLRSFQNRINTTQAAKWYHNLGSLVRIWPQFETGHLSFSCQSKETKRLLLSSVFAPPPPPYPGLSIWQVDVLPLIARMGGGLEPFSTSKSALSFFTYPCFVQRTLV